MAFHKVRTGLYERVPGPPYDAQKAFVERWRRCNPEDTFAQTYMCPLCGEAVQTKVSQAAEYAALGAGDLHQDEIAEHQRWHGDSWTAYMAAGRPAGQEQGDVDER